MASLLVQLADLFITKLSIEDNDAWSDLTVGLTANDFIQPKLVFDPNYAMEADVQGLYVIPVVNDVSIDGSLGRGKKYSLAMNPTLNVALCLPFKTVDANGFDVASEAEVKRVLTLREEIDVYLAGMNWGTPIIETTCSPAQEVRLKQSWFLAVTEFTFGDMKCTKP